MSYQLLIHLRRSHRRRLASSGTRARSQFVLSQCVHGTRSGPYCRWIVGADRWYSSLRLKFFSIASSDVTWRWIYWVMMMFAGTCTFITAIFLPETYAPVLLANRVSNASR